MNDTQAESGSNGGFHSQRLIETNQITAKNGLSNLQSSGEEEEPRSVIGIEVAEQEPKSDVTAVERLHDFLSSMTVKIADDKTREELLNLLSGMEKNEINTRNGQCDETALHIAAQGGLEWVVTILLDAGADLEAKNARGNTPLIEACRNLDEAMTNLLLEKNASYEVITSEGLPLLHRAMFRSSHNLARIFLEKGVTLENTSMDWALLHLMIIRKDELMLRILLEGDSKAVLPSMLDVDGRTLLWTATNRGFLEGVQILLEHGADVNIAGKYQTTPLMVASENNRVDIILQFLSRKGLELNAQDSQGRTALHRVSWNGNSEVMQLFFEHGMNIEIDLQDKDGDTSLHNACSRGHDNLVKVLLKHGANTTIQNTMGNTAFHSAAKQYQEACFETMFLNARDEDIFVEEKNGQTPLCVAYRSGMHEIVKKLLLQRLAIEKSDRETMERAALLWAAGDEERHTLAKSIFRESAERNDDKNMFTKSYEWSAIKWAAKKQLPDVLWLLISKFTRTKNIENEVSSASEMLNREQIQNEEDLTKIDLDYLTDKVHGSENVKDSKQTRIKMPDAKGNKISASEMLNREQIQNKEDLTKIDLNHLTDKVHGSENVEDSKQTRIKMLDAKGNETSANDIRSLCIDILKYPPFSTIYTNDRTFEAPRLHSKHSSAVAAFEAAVIEFYKDPSGSRTVQRFRSVNDVIYDPMFGPKKIMKDAAEIAEQIINVIPKITQEGIKRSFLEESHVNTKPKFTWIHLPATNMQWMDDLLKRIMKDGDYNASQFREVSALLRDTWSEIPDKTSPSRTMRPRVVVRNLKKDEDGEDKMEDKNRRATVKEERKDMADNEKSNSQNEDIKGEKRDIKVSEQERDTAIPTTAFYMPYLSLSIEYKAKENTNPDKEESSNSLVQSLRNSKEEYMNLLKAYESSVIHQSSTLDEFYYHFGADIDSEKDQTHRNQNQVVTHVWMKPKAELKNYPLIRVNQLWVWIIDNKWLITSSTHPIDSKHNPLLNGVLEHLKKRAEAGGSSSQPGSAAEMSQLLADYCIAFYDKWQNLHCADKGAGDSMELSIRDAFSKYMNRIGRDETSLFKRFTEEMKSWKDEIQSSLTSSDKGIEKAATKARDLLEDIKDIRDELNILKTIAIHQQRVQNGLYPKNTPDLLSDYVVKDIKEMDNIADRIQSAVNTTLSLQQSEVANIQANVSVKQGHEAVKQGKTLMVFTVVTIIFAPLSFLPALFAVDVETFQKAPAWALWTIFCIPFFVFAPPAFCFVYWDKVTKHLPQYLGGARRSGQGKMKIGDTFKTASYKDSESGTTILTSRKLNNFSPKHDVIPVVAGAPPTSKIGMFGGITATANDRFAGRFKFQREKMIHGKV